MHLAIATAMLLTALGIHQAFLFPDPVMSKHKNTMNITDLARTPEELDLVLSSSGEGAQFKTTPRKLIIMSIDGMRGDLIEGSGADFGYNREKFHFIEKLRQEKPDETRLFLVDVLQDTYTTDKLTQAYTGRQITWANRQKALLGEYLNFLEDDNVFNQMHAVRSHRSSIIMNGGQIYQLKLSPYTDKLWVSPEGGSIRDTYTCDQNGFTKLHQMIEDDQPEMVAFHVVGLDHIHHTYGINTDIENKTLPDIEEQIKKTIELMDDNTTFVMFGDHGYNENGKHGFNSISERTSALFVYSKGGNFWGPQEAELINGTNIAPIISQLAGTVTPQLNTGHIRKDTAVYPNDISENAKERDFATQLMLNMKQIYAKLMHDNKTSSINITPEIFKYLNETADNLLDHYFELQRSNHSGTAFLYAEFEMWHRYTFGIYYVARMPGIHEYLALAVMALAFVSVLMSVAMEFKELEITTGVFFTGLCLTLTVVCNWLVTKNPTVKVTIALLVGCLHLVRISILWFKAKQVDF